jgi:hypothetical protein
MRIQCPSESYDVNIEPAKDEVLFFRPHELLSRVDKLLRSSYPKIAGPEHDLSDVESMLGRSISQQVQRTPVMNPELGDRASASPSTEELEDLADATPCTDPRGTSKNPFTIAAMNAVIKPRKMDLNSTEPHSSGSVTPEDEVRRAFERIRQQPTSGTSTTTACHLSQFSVPDPTVTNRDLSPPTSPQPGPPLRRWAKAPNRSSERSNDFEASRSSQPNQGLRTWLGLGTVTLEPFPGDDTSTAARLGTNYSALHIPAFSPTLPSRSSTGNLAINRLGGAPRPFKASFRQHGTKAAFDERLMTPPSSISGPPADCSGLSYDFNDCDDASFEPPIARSRRGGHGAGRVSLDEPVPSVDEELEDIMDFEHRKKAAIASQRRVAGRHPTTPLRDILARSGQTRTSPQVPSPASMVEVRSSQGTESDDYGGRFGDPDVSSAKTLGSNPHRNRYLKAVQRLSHAHFNDDDQSLESGPHETAVKAAATQATLAQNDPRAYFIRQRARGSKSSLHRTKSLKLPLECPIAGTETFELQATIDGYDAITKIHGQIGHLAEHDSYTKTGKFEHCNFEGATIDLMHTWDTTLQDLMQNLYRQNDDEVVSDMKLDIARAIANHAGRSQIEID